MRYLIHLGSIVRLTEAGYKNFLRCKAEEREVYPETFGVVVGKAKDVSTLSTEDARGMLYRLTGKLPKRKFV